MTRVAVVLLTTVPMGALAFSAPAARVHPQLAAHPTSYAVDAGDRSTSPILPAIPDAGFTARMARGRNACGPDCPDLGRISITAVATDDMTAPGAIGYRFTVQVGALPAGFNLPAFAMDPAGSYVTLFWSDDDSSGEAFDFTLQRRGDRSGGQRERAADRTRPRRPARPLRGRARRRLTIGARRARGGGAAARRAPAEAPNAMSESRCGDRNRDPRAKMCSNRPSMKRLSLLVAAAIAAGVASVPADARACSLVGPQPHIVDPALQASDQVPPMLPAPLPARIKRGELPQQTGCGAGLELRRPRHHLHHRTGDRRHDAARKDRLPAIARERHVARGPHPARPTRSSPENRATNCCCTGPTAPTSRHSPSRSASSRSISRATKVHRSSC